MRPVFCGNFDFEARQSDLERLFRKYGKVERVDMKSGNCCILILTFHVLAVTSFLFFSPRKSHSDPLWHRHPTFASDTIAFPHEFSQSPFSDMFPRFAFVYMEDERDAEDAIRGLDRFEFGRKGRRLRVEWTKQERGIRRPVDSRRSSTNSRPSKTLFVINFDPYHTRTRDLEKHFDPYGKILNVRIRKNFAFIQFESEEDARRALEATNMSKLMDRVISVEFAIKDDDDRRNGYSPDRGRDRSPGRRAQDRGRSPSPYRRERASPDYGRGRSPSPYRKDRASPDYGRGGPTTSPRKRERADSEYDHGRTRSPRRVRPSPDNHGREPNPRERVVSPDYGRGHNRSPKGERISPDDYQRSPSPQRQKVSPDDYRRSSIPQREKVSPDDYRRSPSPDAKHEMRDSPKFDEAEDSPTQERYGSRSPVERERSLAIKDCGSECKGIIRLERRLGLAPVVTLKLICLCLDSILDTGLFSRSFWGTGYLATSRKSFMYPDYLAPSRKSLCS
ncbi:hypothetical protein RHSIM_Rhsim09G0196200 [Rhododendron simsii]|uniref:RRM domain-containing protein n=1 Tax=Rhododendron simsii TaxID=118357 RepID=A0A834GFK5_RHOSS|nr:hypothetical protein RHSIM_Rhsim09G0196200 [Rhododendron simsii]